VDLGAPVKLEEGQGIVKGRCMEVVVVVVLVKEHRMVKKVANRRDLVVVILHRVVNHRTLVNSAVKHCMVQKPDQRYSRT
jgi:hypothetical protein